MDRTISADGTRPWGPKHWMTFGWPGVGRATEGLMSAWMETIPLMASQIFSPASCVIVGEGDLAQACAAAVAEANFETIVIGPDAAGIALKATTASAFDIRAINVSLE